MRKLILDLCGGTGAWSKPFQDDPEFEVVVCTLPKFDVNNWRNDVWLYDNLKDVYGIIAAPPCTQFSIARNDKTALKKRSFREGMKTIEACLDIVWETRKVQSELYGHTNNEVKLKFWALENPNSGYLKKFLGKPSMVFQPYEFGDPYTKKTALWGDFNEPKKKPIKEQRFERGGTFVENVEDFFHLKEKQIPEGYQKLTGYSKRNIVRSITPEGFAKAFYEANR